MNEEQYRSFGDIMATSDLDLITDVLDSESIDLNAGDEWSNLETPLMQLCHSELEDEDAAAILELMLLKKPDVNKQDGEGRTALCHACMTGLTHFIQRLAQVSECDPNIADIYGNTALMFGVYYGELDVVRMLIESFDAHGRRVDLTKENDEGINALRLATQHGFTEIINLLKLHTSRYNQNHYNSCNSNDVRVSTKHQPPVDAQTGETSYVGSKASGFRRRKFKPAASVPVLGPLVVQNRLQSSKSADYVENYRQSTTDDAKREAVKRQLSCSAVSSAEVCDVSEKLAYQTDHFDDQYMAEDERSDTTSASDEDSENRCDSREASLARSTKANASGDGTNVLEDEGYEESGQRSAGKQRRRPSISLPDLRNKQTPPGGSYCDSGYDTRSGRLTITQEDLSLPEIPEPDSSSNEDDYTPRTRRDSISLPDLRGLRRCLVGSPSGSSPPLNVRQIQKAALIDIRQNEVLAKDAKEDDAFADDDFETLTLNTSRTRKNDDKTSLTLPSVAETNKVIAPSAPVEPKGLSSRRYKAWGTPRQNSTSRAPTMSELNKKIATRHKILTDRA